MQDIDSQLNALMHGKILTTLDLSNGFLRIPLTQNAKQKTAFFTEEETAQFERMLFCLQEAPGELQKQITLVLKELKNQGIVSL